MRLRRGGRAFVLFAFGLLGARLATCRSEARRALDAGREQPHRGRADRAQPRPDPRPQRRRAGHQLLGLHARDHAVQGGATSKRTIDRSSPRSSTSSRATGKRFKRLLEESKSFESLPIRTALTDEEVARFTAQRFRFEGVDIKARLFRNYPLGEVGSHLIGYIGRINQAEKKKMATTGRGRPRQLPRHRVHRQARRRAELREPSCTARPASRRSR